MRAFLIVIVSVCCAISGITQSPDSNMVNKSTIQKDNLKVKLPANPDKVGPNPDLSGWPEIARTAAREMTGKYGKPDEVNDKQLVWTNKGPWKSIRVTREETMHNFPVEHNDVLEQTIYYKVPPEKLEAINAFDSNISVDMTAGTIGVRCDKESNNFLTLNLVNDIVLDKKTVAQARKSYVNILAEKKNGGISTYLEKLMFSIERPLGNSNTNPPEISGKDMTKS